MYLLAGALTFVLPVIAVTSVARRSPNIQTPHVIELSRTFRHAKSLQEVDHGNGTVGIATLTDYEDILYYTDITFGTEVFKVVVDTGSADSWLIEEGFQCVDVYSGLTYPETKCAFGPPYKPSSTFTDVAGENFNISYADGETLTGSLG